MSVDRKLLRSLLRENPFQPATGLWRAIELAVVIRHGLPHGRGLDLGCGDGKLMRVLLDAAPGRPRELVGVDPDPLETRDAERSGVYARIHTVPGARVPEPDASFDFVFSNSVLEHIDDLEPVIAEVGRLLRPGGRFLFTVPSTQFHSCLRGPLLPGARREDYLAGIDRRCAHRRYWDEAAWRACLGRHGLRLTTAAPYLSRGAVRRWETVSRLTAGWLFALFAGRKHPIEIQRALGLRRRAIRLPSWLAELSARVLAAGLRDDPQPPHGCLIVEAVRPQDGA